MFQQYNEILATWQMLGDYFAVGVSITAIMVASIKILETIAEKR